MAKQPKKRDVTFYLLKEDIQSFDQAINDPSSLDTYSVPSGFGLVGQFYLRSPRKNLPWWIGLVREAIPDLGDIFNSNTAAVLLLEADNRRFAITFGFGRNLLALNAIERDFGLRVALNSVDPRSLRSVDARTFEELTVTRRTQTSRSTGLETFGLNESQELLKAVTGKPRDSAFAHRITGADAAKVTYAPTLKEIGTKCQQLLSFYRSNSYKERFGFIDHLAEVRDKAEINQLNSLVIEKLRRRESQNIHLAPPEVADWAEIDSFVFSHLSNESFEDLDIEDYLNSVQVDRLTIDAVKRDKVGILFGGTAEPHYRWTVFDTIICEIRDKEVLFVLTGGSWYRVHAEFATQVFSEISDKAAVLSILPHADAGEREEDYNSRVSGTSVFLFDQILVRASAANASIEFCDLMTSDKKLIHVKRKSRSSTLSHLFSQGVVAAEVFVSDKGFREELKSVASKEVDTNADKLLPIHRPDTQEWEVVFAVITAPQKEWPRSLPFFSQLNFRNAADRLTRLGFKVSITQIPTQSQ